MRDYPNSYYTIKVKDIEKHVRECKEFGCSVFLVMNGEYYDIDINKQEKKRGNQNEKI